MRASLAALATVVTLLLFLTLRGGAQSLQEIPLSSAATNSPVVVELFTSQSCSSCPPAERLFAGLAERQDLIVLEWHVDYWDRLVHGRAGAWKDPYSRADHTKRQRQYNRALRGTNGVYTPQAVVNGRLETVGSRASEVLKLLVTAPHVSAALDIREDGGGLRATISELERRLEQTAGVYQLTLLPEQTTSVPRGENRGAVLTSRNIVLAAEQIGEYSGDAATFELAPSVEGHTCAVIVQEKRGGQLGPIISASYC